MTNNSIRVLFGTTSKKVQIVKLESSWRLLFCSKKVHPQIKNEDEDSAFNDGNLLLYVVFKMHSGVPPHQGSKLHEKQLQTLSTSKLEPIGGPNSGRAGSIGVLRQEWKSPVQPFQYFSQKIKMRGKTPLM